MLGSATTVSSFIMAKNMGHEGSLTANTVMLTNVRQCLYADVLAVSDENAGVYLTGLRISALIFSTPKACPGFCPGTLLSIIKIRKRGKRMDFKKCGQSITDWEKRKEKNSAFLRNLGKIRKKSSRFRNIRVPQMRRENWTNLNGWWEYAFTETQKMPKQRDGKILVPFSPECDASGVKRQLLPKESSVVLPHDSASQNSCRKTAAAAVRRRGSGCGNLLQRKACRKAISAGIFFFSGSYAVSQTGENELAVKVRDETDTDWKGRGKAEPYPGRHVLHRAERHLAERLDGMGAETYLERIVITPEYDTASVKVRVFLNGPDAGLDEKNYGAEGERSAGCEGDLRPETRENEAELILGNFAGWSPEHPHLYGVSIEAGEDRIESYFGMRKFGIGKDEKGITRLLLNGKPYFQNGGPRPGLLAGKLLHAAVR